MREPSWPFKSPYRTLSGSRLKPFVSAYGFLPNGSPCLLEYASAN